MQKPQRIICIQFEVRVPEELLKGLAQSFLELGQGKYTSIIDVASLQVIGYAGQTYHNKDMFNLFAEAVLNARFFDVIIKAKSDDKSNSE